MYVCGDTCTYPVAAIHAHHKEGGRLGIIRLLLRNKSNVESTNAAGWTALTKAAYKGFVHVMELLLESGANVDAATATGFTPLIAAAQVKVPLKTIPCHAMPYLFTYGVMRYWIFIGALLCSQNIYCYLIRLKVLSE